MARHAPVMAQARRTGKVRNSAALEQGGADDAPHGPHPPPYAMQQNGTGEDTGVTQHSQKVLCAVTSGAQSAKSQIAASWTRSFHHHGLDPETRGPARVFSAREMKERFERFDRLLAIATPKCDDLFNVIGTSGCAVVLTDDEGVIMRQAAQSSDDPYFQSWGLSAGADWSEQVQGTNGIGTCLVEGRGMIVHRDQHFMAQNVSLSCIGAPIYGACGEILGVLDVSSARADQTAPINKLVSAMVAQTAKAIEIDHFKSVFGGNRIVLAGTEENTQSALLAVDAHDVVVGATRAARKYYGWQLGRALEPCAATDVFDNETELAGFDRAEKTAIVKALTRAGGNASAAAKALGIGRATLYRRMTKLGVK